MRAGATYSMYVRDGNGALVFLGMVTPVTREAPELPPDAPYQFASEKADKLPPANGPRGRWGGLK